MLFEQWIANTPISYGLGRLIFLLSRFNARANLFLNWIYIGKTVNDFEKMIVNIKKNSSSKRKPVVDDLLSYYTNVIGIEESANKYIENIRLDQESTLNPCNSNKELFFFIFYWNSALYIYIYIYKRNNLKIEYQHT